MVATAFWGLERLLMTGSAKLMIMIKRLVLLVTFVNCAVSAMAGMASGAYPLAVTVRNVIYVVEAGNGQIIVRQRNVAGNGFEEILRQDEPRLIGNAVAIDVGDAGRVAILTTERHQKYQLWELTVGLQPTRARLVWEGSAEATFFSVHASRLGYVIAGDYEVLQLAGGRQCVTQTAGRHVASWVSSDSVVVTGEGGLVAIPLGRCDERSVRHVSLRAMAIARAAKGWVVVVRSARRLYLMLLDEDFHPSGLIPLDGLHSWRLAQVGHAIVATAAGSPYAYEIGAGEPRRLRFDGGGNGYVVPSPGGDRVVATDGTRTWSVVAATPEHWRHPYAVLGAYLDWRVILIYAAGLLAALVLLIVGIRRAVT
jgi:hypothetical protein